MNTIAFPKLGLEFNLNQVAFSIGNFDIAWYAIIIAVGFLLAVFYAMTRMRQFGLDEDRALDAIIFGMIGGIIGARVYFVAFSWDQYKDNLLSIFNTRLGGLAIYGGLIGALLVGGLVCRIRKVKVLPMFDITVLGFLLGQGIGRWGNFVNAEAYGSATNSIFGMTINGGSAVHPCFLYESIWCLLGFVLLHLYSKHRKFDGELVLMYCMWYGLERMVVEGLREDSLYWGPFRISQVLSGILFVAALIVWLVIRSKIKRNNDPEYLKLYVLTDASKEMLEKADEKLNKKYNKKNKGEMTEETASDAKETEETEKEEIASAESDEEDSSEPTDQENTEEKTKETAEEATEESEKETSVEADAGEEKKDGTDH